MVLKSINIELIFNLKLKEIIKVNFNFLKCFFHIKFKLFSKTCSFNPFITNGTIRPKNIFKATIGINTN